MCRNEDCPKHELWGGLCRDHLLQQMEEAGVVNAGVAKPKRKSRKKKIDATEVVTTDADAPVEERNDLDA